MRLGRDFYQQDTVTLAQSLLGKRFVRILPEGRVSGWIVEVEAYLSSGDAASHSFRGKGKKNHSMYLNPGTLYVYPIHAKFCMNVVTEEEGQGAAVLIRALEPSDGSEIIRRRREGALERDWMRGPGRTCMALGIDRSLDGVCLQADDSLVFIEDNLEQEFQRKITVTTSPRIGIREASEKMLRYFIDSNRYVSGLARLHKNRNKTSLIPFASS